MGFAFNQARLKKVTDELQDMMDAVAVTEAQIAAAQAALAKYETGATVKPQEHTLPWPSGKGLLPPAQVLEKQGLPTYTEEKLKQILEPEDKKEDKGLSPVVVVGAGIALGLLLTRRKK